MNAAVLPVHWSDTVPRASDRGVSAEAERLRLLGIPVPVALSVSVEQAHQDTVQALTEVFDEASHPNWDGYGARPVSPGTLEQALTLLDALPTELPRPEVAAHPDGELAFEWFFGPRRLLTLSINESGRLSYAALIGHVRQHGTEFLVDTIPEPVVLALRRLHEPE